MDVTVKNFTQVLPEVLEAIDSCDFIAIDGEFTGLRNGPNVTAYDTPSVYYTKMRDGSLNFLLVQVGICTFKFDRTKNKYVYKAFNFYVFPRSTSRTNDVNFLCQSSCINFLCSTGFDFNKCFKEGISYLNIADEEVLQEELVAKYENLKQSESLPKVPIPDELLSTVEHACTRIENFLAPENEEKEITFDWCNALTRKLIFQTAYERFSTKVFSLNTKRINNCPILVAQKGKSKAEREKESYEKDKNDISEAVGFSKVIRHISNSQKLIVGHNMLLDILHIVNRFYWPLPNDYWEFKDMVHQLFPRIIDTKYMCSAYPFRDLIPSSVVDHMLKRLHEPPFEFPEADAENPDICYSMDDNKAHEAGYDAYVTGLAFLSLTAYLDKKSSQHYLLHTPELLKKFENRLFLMRIFDYSFMNLTGEEPKPTRKHVFHITFPKEWRTNDIAQLFSPYGNVHISYCDQISAWVTLMKEEKAGDVVADLIESHLKEVPGLRKPYSIVTWSAFVDASSISKSTNSSIIPQQSLPSANTTATPTVSSTSVPRSSGDAEPVDVDAKPPHKRRSNVEDVPWKRKKNECSSFEKDSKSPKVPCDKKLKNTAEAIHLQSTSKGSCNTLFEQMEGNEDSLQKTFDEPSWE